MLFKILMALTIIAEFFTVPMFLKYYWPTKCKQSLLFKMISATLFVLCGVFAMKASGNNTSYAVLIVWGLVFGWLGDYFLHSLKDRMVEFIIGVVAFLIGHIFYIAAFYHALKTLEPDAQLINWYDFVAVGVVLALVLVYVAVRKIYQKKGPMVIGLLLYGIFLTAMVVKAVLYMYAEWNYGINDSMVPALLTTGIGSVFFFLSDLSLFFILTGDEVKRGMRIFNIITYFIAQILLAVTILFVSSNVIV
ncbi:MAG: lysoplasmalogenase [Clostridia bacterium]|nr:lysoplasmalogenase [Clostridia bacterium]